MPSTAFTTDGHRDQFCIGACVLSNQGTSGNIIIAIGTALRSHGRKCRVFPADVYFQPNATTYYLPDVSVSCDERDLVRNDGIESPSTIVEVLSASTTLFDHTHKLQVYSACMAIQEYLLIDSTQRLVESYHRLPDGNMVYRTYKDDDTIMLSGLGIELTIADCYYGIVFE